MKLKYALGLLAAINAKEIPLKNQNNQEEALSLLKLGRQPRRNHGTFEEFGKGDNYERECVEEICDKEELSEVFSDEPDKVESEWAKLVDQCHINQCDAQGTSKCVQRWRMRTCVCKQHVDGIETVADVPKFQGDDCSEDFDECADKETNTKCGDRVCKNNHGSFECGCQNGYEDIDSECVDIDECKTQCTSDDQICKNLPGSFECACKDGYEDDGQGGCKDVNECEDEDICSGSVLSKKCVNTPGSYFCECNEPGYSDLAGECEDINECPDGCTGSNSSCTNLPGSFQCTCGSGYQLDETETNCVDINECKNENACVLGKCWNTEGSFECCTTATHNFDELTGACTLKDPCDGVVCGLGYQCNIIGECVDIDECDQEDICEADHTCENTNGSYTCLAPETTVPNIGFGVAGTTMPEATTTVAPTTTTTTTTTSTRRRCKGRPKRRGKRNLDENVDEFDEDYLECEE